MSDNQTVLAVTFEEETSVDRYKVLYMKGLRSRCDWITCNVKSVVPMAEAAALVLKCGIETADFVIVSAPNRHISHWPPKWKPKRLRILAIDCPDEAIHADLSRLALVVDKVPRFNTPLRLEQLNMVVQHLPPNLHFAHVTCHSSFVRFKDCEELPVWYARRYGKWHRDSDSVVLVADLDLLYHLLIQGLTASGPFQQWLTKGLYDPRLWRVIVSLL